MADQSKMNNLITTEQKNSSRLAVKMILAFLLIVTIFITGFYIGKAAVSLNASNTVTPSDYVLVGDKKATFKGIDVDLLWEVWNYLESDYINKTLDGESLLYGAAKGLVHGLDDPYSSLLTPEETAAYFSANKGEFEGIGATLKQEGDYTAIESPIDDSPAQKAGLLANDIILEVDGKSTRGQSVFQTASIIRGNAGTDVTLKIYRNSTDKEFTVTITRQKIDIDNISLQELENDIVKIKIYKFTEETVAAFNSQWDVIVEKILAKPNVKGIVVDLRNNPGGYVNSVEYVLGEFLQKGQVVFLEQDRNGKSIEHKVQRTGKFLDVPMVVIVNAGSASASEIFAGALQDNARAKVIGTETVGKGVEQKLLTLSDGSTLQLVFQKWLTPGGKNITKESPIKPDEVVEDYDQQDAKALELLKK